MVQIKVVSYAQHADGKHVTTLQVESDVPVTIDSGARDRIGKLFEVPSQPEAEKQKSKKGEK